MKRSVLECTESGIKIIPDGGDIWMTKHEIARLFGCFIAKVVSNISSILKAEILDGNAVCRLHRYDSGGFVEFYNMEMIMALAFRIKSHNAEVFRQWLLQRVTDEIRCERISLLISLVNNTLPN